MAAGKKHTINMTEGPIFKNMWYFAIPLMLTNFLQQLFNAADAIIVGRFAGQQALASVGATSSLCFLMITLFSGLSMGSNVLIARFLGAGDREKVERSVHTSVVLAFVSGLMMAVLGYFAARPILTLMSTPSDIIDGSVLYMRIFFIGTFFGSIYNFGASIMRAKGDAQRPLYFLFISGGANVLLNLFFVVVMKMGVAGVATATVISQAIGAALVSIALIRETDETRVDISRLRELGLDGKMVLGIIKIGVPASIQGMVFSLSNVVVQSGINSFDDSVIVAGNAAAGNIEDFCYIGMVAFQQACMTFTSQCIGARKLSRVKDIMKISLVMTILITISISLVIWGFGDFFLRFYTTENAVVETGKIRLTFVILPLVLNGILDVFVASMRGMGYSLLPTATMIVGICGVRLTWLFAVFPAFRTLPMIYLCFPISWAITGAVQAVFWVRCHRHLLSTGEGHAI